MIRGRLSKFISIVITGVIAISGLPSMVLADVINAPTYYSVQSDLNYEITTNITSSWSNHESIDLVLTNTGSDTIHNWYLTFNTPYNIENIWNSNINETDGNGTYTITSNGWNQDIHTGESVTVGITFSSDTETELSINPEWYLLNTQATVVDASLYTLDYTEYSSWESGFTGQLTLTPQGDCQHWELSFSSNREITAVSSAVLIPEDDNNYAITHDENNMRLLASNAYIFGIQGVSTVDSLELSNVELTVVDLAYHLTDDADANGIPDYLEFIGGGSIIDPTPTPTPVPTDVPTATPTEDPTGTPTTEPTDTETPTPTPIIDYEADQDLDGLPDYIEEQLGTDPLKADTDDDLLNDYIEVMTGYDPTNPDTDNNGIIDGNEDFDNDDLLNTQELQLGTELCFEDTDGDNLNDGDEVNVYGTDPLVPDTDGDGIKDGDEVSIGKNPSDSSDGATRIPQTFTWTISNPEDAAITSVDVSISVANRIDRVVDVDDYYNVDVYSTGVYGRIGSPLNFECDEDFDTATVVIHYDESSLGDTLEEELGVLWFDEESGFYITQDQAVIDTANNTVTLVLEHFSTYVLVNLNLWNNPQLTPIASTTSSIRTVVWSTPGVYYDSAPIIETNDSGQYVLVGWTQGTIAPERNERNAWNEYLATHPNDVCVETVNMRAMQYSWGGMSYMYTWKVYTADAPDTDNDHDGVPDALETNGIYAYGQNEMYTSLTSTEYSDDDNLSDLDEYRIIYVVSKSSEDGSITVRRISSVGQEVLESDSVFYELAVSYVDSIMDPGETFAFCTPKSNPDDSDSDDDFYYDDIDNHPMRSGLVTIDLGGDSYNVRQDDAGYIHVRYRPNEDHDYASYYGGYQSWFEFEDYYGINLFIRDTGCGLIATNDSLLYLDNGADEYEWGAYRRSVLDTYNDYLEAQLLWGSHIPNSFSVSSIFVQRCLEYRGYSNRLYFVSERNQQNLLDEIESSLQNNRPVILFEADRVQYYSEGVLGNYSPIDRNGFPLYVIDKNPESVITSFEDLFLQPSNHPSMTYHYVTITGIVINSDAQDGNDSVFLRVQSWGGEYYINYSDFVNYNESYATCMGEIIIID